jgi:ferredoxin-like protein FixX
MPKKLTSEQFIQTSNLIHHNKYDYSEVVYVNSKSPVTIICPTHGKFTQTPNNHTIAKQGCKMCGINCTSIKNSLNTKTFIEKSRHIHGELYDYSQTIYTRTYDPVNIICPSHGIFSVVAKEHTSVKHKRGCPECSRISYRNKRQKVLSDFIADATSIHGNIYDYSQVEYNTTFEKVSVICAKHGPFWVPPNAHVSGKTGCPKCNMSKGERLIKQRLEQFGISFQQQKTFETCVNDITNKKLRFDFYLTKQNILIEYDGESHFTPVKFNGMTEEQSISEYMRGQYRDILKNNWSIENNIYLIRIPYYIPKEDFDNIFKELSCI